VPGIAGRRWHSRRGWCQPGGQPPVAHFVAIHQEAWPNRLGELLTTIRQSLALAPTLHPGRRTTRLFQRLGRPTQFVAVSEWSDAQAFDQFRTWPVFVQTVAVCGPPPKIEPLIALRRFERMERRSAVASCVTVTAAPHQEAAVRDYLLRDAHQRVSSQHGLVSRELYESRVTPGRFLVLRGWSSLADLERFRATDAAELYESHRRLGSSIERFTGALAAELSLLAS
jgi:quinol monooxygenase YgiN